MKKFLNWFKNSTRIKRWIVLILVGIVLTCFGFAKIFTSNELEFWDLLEIILTFVIGFVCFVLGIVYIQKRNLEILVEKNNIDLNNTNDNSELNTLISENSIYKKGPNIVVIGGGTGVNNILRGLKNYTSNLTAILPVSSYGDPLSKSLQELKLNPVNDIKTGIISLSSTNEDMNKILNYTFDEGKLKDLNFGDLYLYVMQKVYGDFATSIERTNLILSVVGKVLPVSLDEMNICAELEDGTIVEEKSKISETVTNHVTKINRVYLNPSNCRTTPKVIEAIENADAIIIGPGSLYTNVIPNLLIRNVSKTIRESKALKIYISNIMTEPGQTDDYDVSDHINSILEHSGKGIINFCISDVGEIIPEYIKKYNLRGSDLVNIDTENIKKLGVRLLKGDFATIEDNYIRHDPDKTAKLIIELICTDLKFKDKSSDEQYVLLNLKLKEEEEKEKSEQVKAKHLKEKKKAERETKKNSKFVNKYKDRIKAIQESEKTRLENIRIHEKARRMINEEEQKEKARFLKEIYDDKNKN